MNAPVAHPPAIRTTCPYCGVGCGILARPNGLGGADIAGDPEHPANFGRLCSKGSALGETLGLDGRLLHPMARQGGSLAKISWDDALDRVATGFQRVVARYGPEAVAFYLSGQLLTEDYYVANKLMKGFIGSANVDTNSRLCMASSVAGHKRAFGSDTVPGAYTDLDVADLIVLVGSNAAWCHPILFQRIMRNRSERSARVVVIDPRRTATADEADLFLPIAPGMDTALFCGLLIHLAEAGTADEGYIAAHTAGFAPALARAREIAPTLAATAAATGLAEADIARFFTWFETTPRTVTCFSQGVNQSAQGTDKVNAIVNCHLATGRIGKPGQGPFSLTGQPNAMGGREVGGLANQLAAHMDFSPENIARVGRFWRAPSMARLEGLKAVQMFEAIERGEIKALWIMATNPVVSLPRAGAMRDALRRLDLFVVSENVLSNDTVDAGAQILLPATAWGEKGGTATNSERRVSRQHGFLPAPGEAKPDWWIVTEVAKRMGFGAAFSYRSAADIFREHAALSAFENGGTRDFDLGMCATMSDADYDSMTPFQWGGERFFAEGGFFTPNRRANFIPPAPPRLRNPTSEAFPLRLNTGRVRDQWHSMTRSGRSPRLSAHVPEPIAEVHPADAARAGLVDGGLARVLTRDGSSVLKVRVSDGQQRGSLFAPIHWSGTTASAARVGELMAADTDPFSGQPELKATPAAIAPVSFRSCGFALMRTPAALPAASWWSRVALVRGTGVLLASNAPVSDWRDWAHVTYGAAPEFADYLDERQGFYRFALFAAGCLEVCLFVGPADHTPPWGAMKALFEAERLSDAERRAVLSGRSTDGIAETGPLVCACFGVGLVAVSAAITSGAALTVDDIGKVLRAGTNCGSCLPELKRIVSHARDTQTI